MYSYFDGHWKELELALKCTTDICTVCCYIVEMYGWMVVYIRSILDTKFLCTKTTAEIFISTARVSVSVVVVYHSISVSWFTPVTAGFSIHAC